MLWSKVSIMFLSQNAIELESRKLGTKQPRTKLYSNSNKTGSPLVASQRKQKLRGPPEPQKKFTEHKSITVCMKRHQTIRTQIKPFFMDSLPSGCRYFDKQIRNILQNQIQFQ